MIYLFLLLEVTGKHPVWSLCAVWFALWICIKISHIFFGFAFCPVLIVVGLAALVGISLWLPRSGTGSSLFGSIFILVDCTF